MNQSTQKIIIIYFFKSFMTSCPRTRKQQNSGLRVLEGTNKIKDMGRLEGGVSTKGKEDTTLVLYPSL